MANELAKAAGQIVQATPEQLREFNETVVDASSTINSMNSELDILQVNLKKMGELKDKYDQKVKYVRSQLSDIAMKL